MTTWTKALPFFSASELACKGTGAVLLDFRFAVELIHLRSTWDAPLTPSSVCRAPSHNEAVGGHPRSLHLTVPSHPQAHGTMAADFLWANWPTQRQLAFAACAWDLGWAVGLNNAFCHVDLRSLIGRKPTVFTYGSGWSDRFGSRDVTEYV